MKSQILLADAAFALSGCVANLGDTYTGSAIAQEDHAGAVAMPAEDVVQARRVTYFLSTQAVGQIKAGIEEGGDLQRTQRGAMMLARWAEPLPKMFPQGTDIDGSRAFPTVWSDRAGFEAAAENYRLAALNLAEVAKTGDRQAANDAFMAMAGTCQACHQSYREE